MIVFSAMVTLLYIRSSDLVHFRAEDYAPSPASPYFLHPSPLATLFYSVSRVLCFLFVDSTYKWYHAVFVVASFFKFNNMLQLSFHIHTYRLHEFTIAAG